MTEAGLTLHPEKTRTVDMNKAESHFDFLGYRFNPNPAIELKSQS